MDLFVFVNVNFGVYVDSVPGGLCDFPLVCTLYKIANKFNFVFCTAKPP